MVNRDLHISITVYNKCFFSYETVKYADFIDKLLHLEIIIKSFLYTLNKPRN